MQKTDRQTDKRTRWAFTAYEDQWALFEQLPPGIAEWGWQKECCPETNRQHYQGYLRTTQQQRFSWVKKILPGVHIEPCKDWLALIQYCKKEDTRVPGSTPVHAINQIPSHYQYTDSVAQSVAAYFKRTQQPISNITKDRVMQYMEEVVKDDIMSGKTYVFHYASNPSWKNSWKQYGIQLVFFYAHGIDNASRSSLPQERRDSRDSSEEKEESPQDAT